MKELTNEQYKHLQGIAQTKNIVLHGYQTQGGEILLNNSKTSTIYGKSMDELIKSINNA